MIKIFKDRVIIDGHEPIAEQCETMTLLANALTESKDFRKVEYKSGYAEFEKVGKAKELKFAEAGPMLSQASGDLTIDANIAKIVFTSTVEGDSPVEYTYTASGHHVDLSNYGYLDCAITFVSNNYILDSVVVAHGQITNKTDTGFRWVAGSDGGPDGSITITSKSASVRKSVDLTTLSGWAGLADGTHTIKIVAKANGYRDSAPSAGVEVIKGSAPSTVTLEKGTYLFIEEPVIPIGTSIDEKLSAVINTLTGDNEYGSQKTTDRIYVVKSSSAEQGNFGIFNEDPYYEINGVEWKYTDEDGNVFTADEDNSKLRTIVLETDQQVSPELYKWAITDGNLVKQAPSYANYLTFTGKTSEFMLYAVNKTWDGKLEYSTDHNTWTTLAGTEEMHSVGKKLYLRGKGNTTFHANGKGVAWRLSAQADCSGNIQTLLDWENPPTSIPTASCYNSMFVSCSNLTAAPELPATTLTDSCYEYMFEYCTSLTAAPDLPAATLKKRCYTTMFFGCSSLTSTPKLSATTLANACYASMFLDCTSLTSAPSLPATTLTDGCYRNMFKGCSNLTAAPELPATTLAPYCYDSMFYGCTGLYDATELPATTLTERCYNDMFKGCTRLMITLQEGGNKIFTCPSTIPYGAVTDMFNGCKGPANSTPVAGATYYWMAN